MKNYKKIAGYIFILIAVLIVVNLPDMVYPEIDEDGMDTAQYLLETSLNIVRYIVLSILSFVLGMKFLFRN